MSFEDFSSYFCFGLQALHSLIDFFIVKLIEMIVGVLYSSDKSITFILEVKLSNTYNFLRLIQNKSVFPPFHPIVQVISLIYPQCDGNNKQLLDEVEHDIMIYQN